MKRRQPVLGDDEQRARYEYLVRVLPESVLEKAHIAALSDLTSDQRAAVVEVLRPALPADSPATAEPESLAAALRAAGPRDALMRAPRAASFAAHVIGTAPIAAYFTVGAGSVSIDDQPPWVQELAHHDGAPLDAATYRRPTIASGDWPAAIG